MVRHCKFPRSRGSTHGSGQRGDHLPLVRANQRFRGKVQGIGWAVKPEGEIDLPPSGVPYVKRELNWVRVAQRFPVRIEVENPDQDLFRMGASAVAIIKGPPLK